MAPLILTGLLPLTRGVSDNRIDLPAETAEHGYVATLARHGVRSALIGKAHFTTTRTVESTGSPECRESHANCGDNCYIPHMGLQHLELRSAPVRTGRPCRRRATRSSLRPLVERDEASRDFALSERDLRHSRPGIGLRLRTVRTQRHEPTPDLIRGAGELCALREGPDDMDNRFGGLHRGAARADRDAAQPPGRRTGATASRSAWPDPAAGRLGTAARRYDRGRRAPK